MSEIFNYENFSATITDIEGFKKWKKKKFAVNGETFDNIVQTDSYTNEENMNTVFTVKIYYPGDGDCDDDYWINRFDPEECTVQMFFSEMSKYTDKFEFITYTSQFFHEKLGGMCWLIYTQGKGRICIDQLGLKKLDSINDVTQSDHEGMDE
jgi:hypothetical protein